LGNLKFGKEGRCLKKPKSPGGEKTEMFPTEGQKKEKKTTKGGFGAKEGFSEGNGRE